MKPEYNFSQAERGKFYRKDAVLDLPVYLDADIRDWLTERAKAKGIDLGRLVNDLLKRDIELIEAVKKNARRKAGRWEALGASKTDCPVFLFSRRKAARWEALGASKTDCPVFFYPGSVKNRLSCVFLSANSPSSAQKIRLFSLAIHTA